MRSVIALRREHIVPGILGCRSEGAEVLGDGAVRAAWMLGDGRRLMIALNLGETVVDPGLPQGETIYTEGDAEPTALGPRSFIAQFA